MLGKLALILPISDFLLSRCTKSCHMPVNCPHSIEIQADNLAHFLLTLKLKSVKTQSFFDTF